MKPSELVKLNVPADATILGEGDGTGEVILWRDREDGYVAGPGGVGKSRLVFQLAISQILGWPFAGFKTFGPPRRWLLIGNENSVRRLRHQVALLLPDLNEVQRTLIDEFLFIHAVMQDADETLCLEDPATLANWRMTAERIKPDIISVDPWEAAIIGSDCNDSAATRASLQLLRRIFRPHSKRATILLVHHSREGAEAIRRAEGFDAGAFLKGSKSLGTILRFGINVAPERANDGSRVIIACGKVNDAPRFQPRGAVLNETTGRYSLNPYFDVEAWRADIDGRAPNKKISVRQVCELVKGGLTQTRDIVDALQAEASESTVKRFLREAVELGYLANGTRGEYRLGSKQS